MQSGLMASSPSPSPEKASRTNEGLFSVLGNLDSLDHESAHSCSRHVLYFPLGGLIARGSLPPAPS